MMTFTPGTKAIVVPPPEIRGRRVGKRQYKILNLKWTLV
jgi:hypothetical protein